MAWLTAVAAAAAMVLASPIMGQVRSALQAAFPARFVLLVGGAVAAAIAGAILATLVRVRERRTLRYSLLAAALVIGGAYSARTSTGISSVDVVERVHFVEYGVITWLFYRASRRYADVSAVALPFLAATIVAIVEEWFQWYVPARVGEARDVLLNLVAIMCGLLVSAAIDPPAIERRMTHASSKRIACLGAVAVALFGAFIDVVHVGHRIADGSTGIFASRYSQEQLERTALSRQREWQAAPPVTLQRFSREDQYLDEGLWHVRRRNEAWAAGDAAQAWGENRILEKFFAPVLDTPTYAGMHGHRWPPDQESAAALRKNAIHGAGIGFVSRAQPYPVLFWPHIWVRSVVIGLSTLMAAVGFVRRM